MRFLKGVGLFGLVLIIMLWVVLTYSSVETRHSCAGRLEAGTSEKSAEAYLKIQRYRWWVGLWNDSKGTVWIELPHAGVAYFDRVKEVGDMLHFNNSMDGGIGHFSTLSQATSIMMPGQGVFTGGCKTIASQQ